MRPGIKTTEFWIGLAVTLLALLQQQLWPDQPFPKEAFIAVATWIAGRLAQKTLGNGEASTKRAWQTTEFWLAVLFAIVKFFFPALPEGITDFVYVYILGRSATKTNLVNLLPTKKAEGSVG